MTEWPEIERIAADNKIGVKTFYNGIQYGIAKPTKGIFSGKRANIDQLEQELRAEILKMMSQ